MESVQHSKQVQWYAVLVTDVGIVNGKEMGQKKVLPSTKIGANLVLAGTKMTVLGWKKQQKVLPSTKIRVNLVLVGTKLGVVSNEKFGY